MLLHGSPPPPEPRELSLPGELHRVLDSREWAGIRDYWRMLNRVPLTETDQGFPSLDFAPGGILDPLKADSVIAHLRRYRDSLLSSVEDRGSRAALETVILLTETRASRLSRMNPAFLTRMIPPWTELMKEQALFDLEVRLRELEELRKGGGISEPGFASALDTLFNRFETWALLREAPGLFQVDGSFYHPGDALMEINLLYGTLEDEFGTERLSSFREKWPCLEALLADLLGAYR